MDTRRGLGLSIRWAREKAGLTQDELSDRAGLAYSTLAKIEQGAIKTPSVFTVFAIAQTVGVSVEKLLAGPEKPSVRARQGKAIKFIYCDVNGVMVRFYHHAFVSLAEETGAPFDKVETTFWHYNDIVNRGEISVKEFDKAMARHLGVKRVDWQRHYMGAIQPVEEMQAYLKELKKRYKIGLLSNTMPGFLDIMFKKKLLPKLDFDAIVDSSVVGAVKPEEKIYEAAEVAAGVTDGNIFLIDDSRANLTAAEKLGWHVFWFDDYDPAESIARIGQSLGV
jgi:HAD superfamily hydrolase (TIGR01509 family)